ncbi:MAG: DUF4013 domain-containing protein [Chloroflexi bacterium]|nr:MAG: DUF4013 domain-containing protein [Chloroflexota bacterium]
MRLVAESFAWPFRASWRSAWLVGLLAVIFVPLLFIPLLGYAIEATRTAETGAQGPPAWQLSTRLLLDGLWTSAAVLLIALPFALLLNPLASTLHALGEPNAHVIAFFALALPWGLVSLLLMPHATAAFASSGRPRDLFDFAAALRGVRRDFMTWNVAAAAIVTSWAIGLACAGVLCVGVVPGVFYAILVSAHAAAALHREGPHPSAR